MATVVPMSIGSFQRTSIENVAVGEVGSETVGTFVADGKSFTLKIADMSALGAVAGLGVAMGVEKRREDVESYEHTGTVNGQMQSEAWNKITNRGRFGIMVANRFMIEAEGSVAGTDGLKAAVASIDQGKLLGLAR